MVSCLDRSINLYSIDWVHFSAFIDRDHMEHLQEYRAGHPLRLSLPSLVTARYRAPNPSRNTSSIHSH